MEWHFVVGISGTTQGAFPGPNRVLLVSTMAVATAVSFVIGAMSSELLMGVIMVGWVGLYTVLVVRNFRALMLIGMVACIPLRINYYLSAVVTDFPRAVNGIAVGVEDFCLIGLFLFLCFQVFIRRERKFHLPARMLWPSLLFLALGFVACMRVPSGYHGFCAFLALLRCWVFFVVVANYIRTDNDVILFLLGLFAIVILESLLGLMQLVLGGIPLDFVASGPEEGLKTNITGSMEFARVTGTLGGANLYALFLNMGLIVAFGVFVSRIGYKSLWLRLAALAVICIALPLDILSYSRGAWMAIAFAVVWMSVHILHYYTKSLIKSLLLVLVCGAIVSCVGLSIESVRERLLGEDYGSKEMRIPMIQVAMEMIEEHPLDGVGFGEYCVEMGGYNTTPYELGSKKVYPVHNFIFLLAAEGGIPTLIVYLIFFLAACSYGFKFLKRSVLDAEPLLPFVGAGLVFSLVALMIQCQLIIFNTYAELLYWIFFGAIVAIDYIITERMSKKGPDQESCRADRQTAEGDGKPPEPGGRSPWSSRIRGFPACGLKPARDDRQYTVGEMGDRPGLAAVLPNRGEPGGGEIRRRRA